MDYKNKYFKYKNKYLKLKKKYGGILLGNIENNIPRIPVSIGEIFDKYSILEIKLTKIKDIEKIKLVKKEKELLEPYILKYSLDNKIYESLKNVNNQLWEIEDKLRIKELEKDFNDEFIQLARKVYFTNDKRSVIKKKINLFFKSEIIEVKDYVNYKKINSNNLY